MAPGRSQADDLWFSVKDRQRRLIPAVFSAGTGGMYRPGDRVVYTTTKHSAHPGPKAEAVEPERHGEGYSYNVRKYWLVLDVKADGTLTVVTRRGKQRDIPASDPRLRPARWWESLFLKSRFPLTERINSEPPANQPDGARMSVGA